MDERLDMADVNELMDEELIDGALEYEALDMLNETLKDFNDFLVKMRTMIKQIKVYDSDDPEDEDDGNKVVKGIMHDLVGIKAGSIILDTGKIERKRTEIKRNIEKRRAEMWSIEERIDREEKTRQAMAFNPQI